jgi:hypothetical protein
MHTTLAPEPQNGVSKSKNPCWAHVGLYDTRWSTCEKLSFIEVKCEFLIKELILTKNALKKNRK